MKNSRNLLFKPFIFMLTLICSLLLFCDCDNGPLNKPNTHAVTIFNADPNGMIVAFVDGAPISSGQAVEHGKTVVFTAHTDDGYTVKEWMINGVPVPNNKTNELTVDISAPITVTAVFENVNTYAVTFSAADANGTIAAFVDAVEIASGAMVLHGKTVMFIAAPDSGFIVKEWNFDGEVVIDNKTNAFTINELTAAAAVTAAFEELDCEGEECNPDETYAVMFNAGANGTITASADGAPISSGQAVEHGKTVVFTASPNSGFIVKEWAVGGTVVGDNKENTLTIDELSAITTVTVVFETAGTACVGEECNVDNLGIENAIVIKFGNSVVVNNPLEASVNVEGAGTGHVVIRGTAPVAGGIDIVLSGTASNGSFKAYMSDITENVGMEIRLHLNGVEITNPKGPAISFPRGRNLDSVSVDLVAGKVNKLSDGAGDYDPALILPEESAKGPFFSEAAVVFKGGGELEVRSKSTRPAAAAGGDLRGRHAIVVDHHITIIGGTIKIPESTNDGIHANRRITITGGTLDIKSEGDAIQNERDYPISISGGKLMLETTGIKSHGIACDSNNVDISGTADIKMTVRGNGGKGIRSRGGVNISGGVTVIDTHGHIDSTGVKSGEDDGDGTSSASGVRVHENFIMSGGDLTIRANGGTDANSKGINVNKNATVTGGNINIKSIGNGIKTDGNLNIMTGSGEITVESVEKVAIDCKGTYFRGEDTDVLTRTRTGNYNF